MPHIPGNVQGQIGWDFEQPDLVEGVPAHGRNLVISKIPSNPNSDLSCFNDLMKKFSPQKGRFCILESYMVIFIGLCWHKCLLCSVNLRPRGVLSWPSDVSDPQLRFGHKGWQHHGGATTDRQDLSQEHRNPALVLGKEKSSVNQNQLHILRGSSGEGHCALWHRAEMSHPSQNLWSFLSHTAHDPCSIGDLDCSQVLSTETKGSL